MHFFAMNPRALRKAIFPMPRAFMHFSSVPRFVAAAARDREDAGSFMEMQPAIVVTDLFDKDFARDSAARSRRRALRKTLVGLKSAYD